MPCDYNNSMSKREAAQGIAQSARSLDTANPRGILNFHLRGASTSVGIAWNLFPGHYEQHIGVPASCFGETDYFVTE